MAIRAGGRSAVPRVVLASALFLLGTGAARPEIEESTPLNLFQKVARADLVLQVRVFDGTLRYAIVDVVRSLKGQPPASRLRIQFRDSNFNRTPGIDPITFPNGEEEILFLVPYPHQGRKPKHRDLFELFRGVEGKVVIPAEGAGQVVEAVDRLAVISLLDPASQAAAFAASLRNDNALMVEAALDEIFRLRAATPAITSDLIALLSSRAAALRLQSLRNLTTLFERSGSWAAADWTPDRSREVLGAVLERARNDVDERVRVAAVRGLGAWPERDQVDSELRAIAAGDPAQSVRYEAERVLFSSRSR